jgi:uncharacterized protein (TIGR03000 family)
MARKIFALVIAFVTLASLVPVNGQPADKREVQLRVLLPEDKAKLTIDDKKTEQTGSKRVYVSPPLEPGWDYSYTLSATWETNNYTKVIRTRTVKVQPGADVEVDLRNPDPANPDKFLIRYVPTAENVVEAMCKLAGVGKDDVVYDLGCGDGRIVITAVKAFGAKRGVGVDINADLLKDSRENAKAEGVADRVEFRQEDVLQIKDLGDATVVMLYMGDDVNLRLRPILQKSLKLGARIVSHDFGMGDWKPDETIKVTDQLMGDEHKLYLWKIAR